MQGFRIAPGYSTEGRKNVRAALALPAVEASDVAQAHALYVGAALAAAQSDYAEARRMLEKSLVLRRGLGNPSTSRRRCRRWRWHGCRSATGPALAKASRRRSKIFRSLFRPVRRGDRAVHLGQIESMSTTTRAPVPPRSRPLARPRDQEPGSRRRVRAAARRDRLEAGDLAHARQWLTRSLTVCREAGDKRGDAIAQWWLGRVDLGAAHFESARARLDTALQAFRAWEMQEELLGCLEDQAALVGRRAIRSAPSACSRRRRFHARASVWPRRRAPSDVART